MSKVTDQLSKIQTLFQENNYLTGKQLSEQTGLSVGSVCRAIRLIREQGVGILTTKKGYILAEFAQKTDDVNYLRRLHGRRASDFVSLTAAEKYIRKRWNSVEDQRVLKQIIAPLSSGQGLMASGMKALLSTENSKGV